MSTFSAAGKAARAMGAHFEIAIGKSFEGYANAGIAYLDVMPVPMTPCGRRGAHGEPLYIPKGKAPFDIYGYAPRKVLPWRKEYRFDAKQKTFDLDPALWAKLPVFVGAELKATTKPEDTLSIVKPNGDGSGLEYHQLDALAMVARLGGIARLVWDNGGEVGIIREDQLVNAHAVYERSRATELAGKGKGPRGSRSIPWSVFETVGHATIGGVHCIDWLKVEGE